MYLHMKNVLLGQDCQKLDYYEQTDDKCDQTQYYGCMAGKQR